MKRRRAFSLVELMVTMALMSVVLGVLALLFQSVARSLHQTSQRSSSLEGGLTAFQQVREDLQAAIAIYSPTPGATATTLNVTRMNPYNSTLTQPLLQPSQTWILHAPGAQWSVYYQLQGQALMRTVTPQSGSAWTALVTDNIQGFNCTIETDPSSLPYYALLRAAVLGLSGSSTISLRFPLHLPPAVVSM